MQFLPYLPDGICRFMSLLFDLYFGNYFYLFEMCIFGAGT